MVCPAKLNRHEPNHLARIWRPSDFPPSNFEGPSLVWLQEKLKLKPGQSAAALHQILIPDRGVFSQFSCHCNNLMLPIGRGLP